MQRTAEIYASHWGCDQCGPCLTAANRAVAQAETFVTPFFHNSIPSGGRCKITQQPDEVA